MNKWWYATKKRKAAEFMIKQAYTRFAIQHYWDSLVEAIKGRRRRNATVLLAVSFYVKFKSKTRKFGGYRRKLRNLIRYSFQHLALYMQAAVRATV